MGELISILAVLFFTFSHVMIKKGVRPGSSDNGTFMSFLITLALSSLFWLIWKWFVTDSVDYFNLDGLLWFVIAGIFTTFLGRTWVYLSIQHIGSVRSSAIVKLNPFFTVFIAAYVVDEPITSVVVAGMVLIFTGVFISAQQSFRISRRTEANLGIQDPVAAGSKSLSSGWRGMMRTVVVSGIYFAPLAALCYALGNTFRKKGILIIADPFYGAMIGAIASCLVYLIAGLFAGRYRKSIVATFKQFNGVQFAAGVLMALGQIFFFLALNYIEVSRATLILTLDAVLVIFVSNWVFKTHENINIMTMVSAVLTVAGTVIIILK